jgi:hypothetical protein
MNLKKVTLLVLLSLAAFPAMNYAKSRQDSPAVHAAKVAPVGSFFMRLLTLGHKGH